MILSTERAIGPLASILTASFILKMVLKSRNEKQAREEEKKKKKVERRMSFQSAVIAMNCMPERVNLQDPTINVIMTCDELPKLEDIAEVVKTLFQYHRLASVPRGKEGSADWTFESVGEGVGQAEAEGNPNDANKESSIGIDPLQMVRQVNMDCDTKEQWAKVVQEQQKHSLRKSQKPWWEFVLMNNEGNGDHVLLFRVDHSVADGLSIGKVFTSVLKRIDGSPMTSLVPPSMISNKEQVDGKAKEMIMKTPKAICDVSLLPIGKFDDPIYISKNVVGREVVDSGQRTTIVFEPIPIDFVKKIKNEAGVSFNDVLLAAWSHAIHEFCNYQRCPVIKQKGRDAFCRALMTFGFPNNSSDPSLAVRNRWVPLPIDLCVGLENIVERLVQINKMTTMIKNSPIAHVQRALVNAVLSRIPLKLSREISYGVYSRTGMTCTNVPGPETKVTIAGCEVTSCMFFVNALHPVLSMLSYNGNVNITYAADEIATPQIHLLPSFYIKALVALGNELKIEVPASIIEAAKSFDK